MNRSVQMTDSEVDGVYVLALEGRIVLGEESHSLREKLKRVLAEGKKKIVLSMANLKYIHSAGLGALVAVHYSAKLKRLRELLQSSEKTSAKSCKSPNKRPSSKGY